MNEVQIPKAPPLPMVRLATQLREGLLGAGRKLAPPHVALLETITSHWVGDALAALTRLEVPEALAGGPRAVGELAAELDLHPGSLRRVLRALARQGYFTEAGDVFGLTAQSRPLLRDDAHSLRNMVLETARDRNARLWAQLHRPIQSGGPVWSEVHEEPSLWALLDADPTEHEVFHGAMAEMSRDAAPSFARAWRFGDARTVVDLGGGTGLLLSTILALHPNVRGVLVDSPSVLAGAPAVLERFGVADRCELVPGDVTQKAPEGHDVYVAKHILHGFDQEGAVALLRTWRAAMKPGAHLVIIDLVVPERGPYLAFLDLQMMLGSGGQERTRAEFEEVLEAAGLEFVTVRETVTPFGLIVARVPGDQREDGPGAPAEGRQ